MATFSSDKPVEEEKEVQTEEADQAKTTEEEEEVRTEEADHREEASESLLDLDSINMEDKESEKGAESQKPQEDPTKMQGSDQTMGRGSTSFSCDQNRRLAPQNCSAAQMSQVMMPLEEQIPRSDQTMNRGSTTFSTDQNRRLPPQVMMPIEEQMRISDQTLERGLESFARHENCRFVPPNSSGAQVMMPLEEQIPRGDYQTVNHGSTTFSSGSLESQSPFQQQQQRLTSAQNQSFGTLFPMMMTTQQPGWFIRDHSSASAWRPQILATSVDHQQQHPMVNQLASIVGLQNQTFVPRPLFSPDQTYFVEQPHLNAIASSMYRYYPYMRPEANHLNLRMPHFRSDLVFTLESPSGQPRSFVLLQDQFNPQRFVLSLDDALVYGPILEMDHPQPQQRQHLDFPIDMIHHQDSPKAAAAAPRPQLNHQQMQQRFNQGQHFGFPIDHHQASPNPAAAPRPELTHQQMQQLQPQTQYLTQTRRFNDGPSSHQGQHQQLP